MARERFINPLFQRTDAPNAEPEAARDEAPPEEGPRPDAGGQMALGPLPAAGTGAQRPRAAAGPRSTQRPASRRASARRLVEQEDEPAAPVKFTFYFSPEQLRRLDTLWLRAKLEHRERMNKSEFVRLALDRLLNDFEKNPRRVLDDLRRHRA